jgi:monovalent cation:H+ antiporter-2, CPA2 family
LEHPFILQAIILLAAAVICVPLFQRLRIGQVLGYLVAGVIVGPYLLGLSSNEGATHVLAELGVAFLLFTVGLELPLERIRVIPRPFFGLAVAQILVTGLVIALIAVALGTPVRASVLIGGALALSSTAIVLQMLTSRGMLASRFGRVAFTILIMQDIAVGPLLILVFALGGDTDTLALDLALALAKAVAAVVVILWAGRWLLVRLYDLVAGARNLDAFVGLSLLVILAIGLATSAAGLPADFGAFLAGMLLAGTPYRHQVAAEIQPFRALLLGLFFMTVGMSVDLGLAAQEAPVVVGLTVALLAGKALLLAGLGRAFGLTLGQALRVGILLSQAGEFAFVLLGLAMVGGLVPEGPGQLLVLVTALTMMLTPLLEPLALRLARRAEEATFARQDQDVGLEALANHVVIAGYGRVGRAAGRELSEIGVPFIAVDLDPERIARAKDVGHHVYFGDATRAEVLAAVGVDRARGVVVALDDPMQTLRIVQLLRYIFPVLKIYARAYDSADAEVLEKAGATGVVREVVATGRQLAQAAAALSGDEPPEADTRSRAIGG